jgi:ABC-2 type transport system permease protein
MSKILKFEIYKLFRQKSFYICTAITAALIFISALSNNVISKAAGLKITGWEFTAKAPSNAQLQLIIAIFTTLFICEDFDQNTLKNIISKGYGRDIIYIGKYITSLISLFIMYAVDIIISFCMGTALWGSGKSDVYLKIIFTQLLVLIGYHAFYYAIAFVLGKTGSSIAVSIVGPMMVNLVLALLDNLLKLGDFKFSKYWLDQFMTTATDTTASRGNLTLALIFTLIYTIVFLVVGFVINRKKQF